jgi:hypothetical protein
MLMAHFELELKLTSHFELEFKLKVLFGRNYGITFGTKSSSIVHEELEFRSHSKPKLELKFF